MKRGVRVSLTIFGVLLATAAVVVCIALYVMANHSVSRKVNQVLKTHLAQLRERGIEVSYDTAYVSLLDADIHICNLHFRSDTAALTGRENGIELSLRELELELEGWWLRDVLKSKRLEVDELLLSEPSVTLYIGADEPLLKHLSPSDEDDSAQRIKRMLLATLKKMDLKKMVSEAGISDIRLENGSVKLKNITNRLSVSVENLFVEGHDLSYSLIDSTLHYNDSVYALRVNGLDLTLPDGSFRIGLGELSTSDAGDVRLKNLHVAGAVPKEAKSVKRGQSAVTRLEFRVPEIRTTAINLIRSVQSPLIRLDGVRAKIEQAAVSASDNPNSVALSLHKLELKGLAFCRDDSVKQVAVRDVMLDRASVQLDAPSEKMDLSVASVSAGVHGLWYDLVNGRFGYNDSVYDLSVSGVALSAADELYRVTMDELQTRNGGEICLQGLHAVASMPEKQPATRLEIQMPELRTTPINLLKSVTEPVLRVDGVKAKLSRVVLSSLDTAASSLHMEGGLEALELRGIAFVNKPKQQVLDVRDVVLDRAALRLSDAKQALELSVASVSAGVHALRYDLLSGQFSYSENQYECQVKGVDCTVPGGLMCITLDELSTRNAGAVRLQGMHAWCPLPKPELAERLGKQPSMWTDVQLAELSTTPVSLPRLIKDKAVNIDGVRAKVDRLELYRDVRYESSVPFPMPQEDILKLTMPLQVGTADLSVDDFHVEVAMSTGRVGALDISDAEAHVSNITNRRGQTVTADMRMRMGERCRGELGFGMTINEACDFSLDMLVTDISGSSFDSFLRPLFGVTAACDISKLETHYTGNSQKAQGNFLMLYSGMKVHAYKGESPYKALAKAAGLVNSLSGVVIQPQNPRRHKKEAAPVQVGFERDPMKDFAVYMFGPLISGVVQSVLPGSVVRVIGKVVDKKKAGKAATIQFEDPMAKDTIRFEPVR